MLADLTMHLVPGAPKLRLQIAPQWSQMLVQQFSIATAPRPADSFIIRHHAGECQTLVLAIALRPAQSAAQPRSLDDDFRHVSAHRETPVSSGIRVGRQ